VIRNNLAYDNHGSGISLFKQNGAVPSMRNLIVNNTMVIADDGRYALNIQNGAVGNTVRNNILYSARPVRGAIDISKDSLSGFTSDYNLVVDRFTTTGDDITLTFAQWQSETGHDANSRVASPADIFADLKDYRTLKPDGPAIDAGDAASAPDVDVFGTRRPSGAGVDIGAIEHCAGAECAATADPADPSDPVTPGAVDTAPAPIPTAAEPVTPGQASPGNRGCGCNGGGNDAAGWLVLSLLALALMRRRMST
jgi:MYXO-CTERM domain-containing protein